MWPKIFSPSKGPSPERPHVPARGSPQQADDPDLTPLYQSWHEFNTTTAQWETVANAVEEVHPESFSRQTEDGYKHEMTLATWNVDAFSPLPNDRLSAILSRMLDEAPAPDIIFLQEVCKPMIPFILQDERIRSGWYSSEKDTVQWRGQMFATMVLCSKSRFGHLGKTACGILGRISRIKYRTRYGRDALCSEILLPTSTSNPGPPAFKRIQLVNVHLDSLAVTPSRRPHQLSVVAKLLHDVGHGLVAGDFNPVLPEDNTLIEENKLVDAWKAVRGEEPGYTWGVDGTEPFPPNRMDRVAMVGLTPLHIEVMHPETIALPKSEDAQNRAGKEEAGKEQSVPWSDHSGLKCTFTVDE